jgi:hypothetical protein
MTAGEPPKRPRTGMFVELMRRRYYYQTDDNDLAEELDANPAAGWVYGMLGAGTIVAYGALCLVQGAGWFPFLPVRGQRGLFHFVEGPTAVSAAWVVIGCGLQLHFHSFWGTHRTLSRYHEPAWFVALCLTLVAAAVFVYVQFWPGRP